MVNRLFPNRGGLTPEFVAGVNEFDMFARNLPVYLREKVYRCPCAKCENTKLLPPEEVKVHLYKKGFTSGYWYWTSHGELQPPEGEEVNCIIVHLVFPPKIMLRPMMHITQWLKALLINIF